MWCVLCLASCGTVWAEGEEEGKQAFRCVKVSVTVFIYILFFYSFVRSDVHSFGRSMGIE